MLHGARGNAFGYTSLLAAAQLAWLPTDWHALSAGYVLEWTDVTLYLPTSATGTGMGMRRGRPVSGFGESELDIRASRAIVHSGLGSATLIAELGVYATASYTVSGVFTEETAQDYVDHVLALHAGFQL